MPVTGQVNDACILDRDGIAERSLLTGCDDFALGGNEPGECTYELSLAVPLNAREPDYFAGHDFQIYSLQSGVRNIACNEQRRVATFRIALLRQCVIDRAADNQAENFVLGNAVGGKGATHLAVAQDGDAIRYALHFRQAVRNVDNRRIACGDTLNIDE